jgi:hypothetical protein
MTEVTTPSTEPLPAVAEYTSGFRMVNWFGTAFSFTPQQAACVKVLWLNWLGGTPIVREAEVMLAAGVRARSLKEVFRSGPGSSAWGKLICDGDKRGTVRLREHSAAEQQAAPAISDTESPDE